MASPTTASTPEQSTAVLQVLLNAPAGTPPPGVAPNFNHPPNLAFYIPLTLTLCIGLSTLAVLMRMYTKLFLIRSRALEDYVVILAWVGLVALTVPSGLILRRGGAAHMWNIRLKDYFYLLYYGNLLTIIYGPAIFFVKLSILLQYLRIFVPNRTGNMIMFLGVHVCIWSCLICYSVTTAVLIAMCKPRERLWNLLLPGHCFSFNALFTATGVFNVLSDFTILILPIYPVWRLQMPLKRKLGVIAVFATGFFACVTSVARVYYTWKFASSSDPSYHIIDLGLWTWAEVATGIIVSCLPVLPKFVQHIAPKPHGLRTLGARLRTTFKHKPGRPGIMNTSGVSSKTEQPSNRTDGVDSTSLACTHAYHSQTQLRAEYITLEGIDKVSSKGEISGRQARHLNSVSALHTGGEV